MSEVRFGYVVRETEAARCVVFLPLTVQMSGMWVPKSKTEAFAECDLPSVGIEMKGESVRRQGIPCNITIDNAFLSKIEKKG